MKMQPINQLWWLPYKKVQLLPFQITIGAFCCGGNSENNGLIHSAQFQELNSTLQEFVLLIQQNFILWKGNYTWFSDAHLIGFEIFFLKINSLIYLCMLEAQLDTAEEAGDSSTVSKP